MAHADEFAKYATTELRRARRDHRCTACGETIVQGTSYHRTFGVHDGQAFTAKQCGRCRSIFDAIVKAQPREAICFDLDCGESWEDVIGPCPPDVAALAFMLPSESAGGSL